MADTWLYASVAATALAATSWMRHANEARQQSRHIKKRMGVKGRWDDAFDIEDEELLLDPTIEVPERRSMVLVIGDIYDASPSGLVLRARLKNADLFLKPSEALALIVITGLVSYILAELLFTQGPVISAIIALVSAVVVPWLLLRSRRDRRLQNFTSQLPIAAELMSNALRAGLSLQGAIELVAREIGDPAREEFGLVVREVRLGGSLTDTLEALEQRMPSTDLEVMVTALLVQRVAGGNLIKSMGALSQTLIERQRTTEEIKTMMAEPKFTSYLMPVLSILALATLNRAVPHFLDVLFHTVPGWIVLAFFVGMQVLAFMLIQRFSRINV
ncbi:MAG: type II secretion system F family protein [Herpetosiphonaceae bacterium]|nr:type II secretion system F family protein [Herpetosiphonaceae bacterium]